MQDKENKEITLQSNYYYGGYINYKAFKDYHLNNCIDDTYFKSNHCLLLAFIVEKYHKNDKAPYLMHDGKKYVLMNTNFMADNIINLKVKSRMIKNYIADFKKYNLISVEVRNKNSRYIHVNEELIKLCYEIDYTIRPINFLKNNKPELWKGFVNEWEVYFKTKGGFKEFIDDFNDTRDIKDLSYNTKTIYEHLVNAIRYHLYGKVNVREVKVY